MLSPWLHPSSCCPPPCPFCSPPATPPPFVHRQLKLLPCFSPPRMYQLLSNSGALGQKHWISKPLEAPGTATSQPSTRYQLPSLSVPPAFLIHFRVVMVWNERKRMNLSTIQPFFFYWSWWFTLMGFTLCLKGLGMHPHTLPMVQLTSNDLVKCNILAVHSLARGMFTLLFCNAAFQSNVSEQTKTTTFLSKGKDAACLVSHWLNLSFLDSWIWLSLGMYHRIQNKFAQVRGLARPTVAH